MGELLTLEEIKRRHPCEWVLIVDPETTETLKIIRGKLMWHGEDYEELHKAARASGAKSIATIHTGAESDDTVYCL